MDFHAGPDIQQLAAEAAQEVLGPETDFDVSAEFGESWTGEPSYLFRFNIQKRPDFPLPNGLVRTRLIQRILDKLVARGDTHNAIIRSLILTEPENA